MATSNDLRNHKSARLFENILPILLGLVCVILFFLFPASNYRAVIWTFAITIVIFLARILRAVHEGLHVIAALWLHVPGSQISAKGRFTWTGCTPKNVWVKVTLLPLLLPFLAIVLIAPNNFHSAMLSSMIFLSGSARDIAYVILACRLPGKFVSNTERGLFVLDECQGG